MKGKFYILFFVSSFFSTAIFAQSENKKSDSTTPAKQIISKDHGEKDLPDQLKKKQIQKNPEVLKDSTAATTPATNKDKKNKCKHKKKSK